MHWRPAQDFCGPVPARFQYQVCELWRQACPVLEPGWDSAGEQEGSHSQDPGHLRPDHALPSLCSGKPTALHVARKGAPLIQIHSCSEI